MTEWEDEFRGASLHSLIKKIKGHCMRITSQNGTQNYYQKNTYHKYDFQPFAIFLNNF